jgi:hypothetical protein
MHNDHMLSSRRLTSFLLEACNRTMNPSKRLARVPNSRVVERIAIVPGDEIVGACCRNIVQLGYAASSLR